MPNEGMQYGNGKLEAGSVSPYILNFSEWTNV